MGPQGIMGPIGPPGIQGVTGVMGVTGVTGPTGSLFTVPGVSGAIVTIDATGTGVTGIVLTGFTANRVSTDVINSDYTFNQPWTVNLPYYNDGNFNTATGVYTVPVSGIYDIGAMIPFRNLEAARDIVSSPGFAITRNGLIVIWGDIINYGESQGRTTSVGTVTLAGQLILTAGDELTLRYSAEDNTVPYYFGPSADRPVVWSVRQIL